MEYIQLYKGNSDICYSVNEPWGHYTNEISQSQEDKHCVIPLTWNICSSQIHRTEIRTVVSRSWGGVRLENGMKWSEVKVAQSCPPLCEPMNCSLLGTSVHGILQARVLEWVANSFSRGSSWHRDWTQVSCIAGRFFTNWATREALFNVYRVAVLQDEKI